MGKKNKWGGITKNRQPRNLRWNLFSKKLVLAILSCIFWVFLMSGCWNYQEVDDVIIAIGLAIDKNEKGDFVITGEMVYPGQDDELTSEVRGVEGNNVFDGVRKLIS